MSSSSYGPAAAGAGAGARAPGGKKRKADDAPAESEAKKAAGEAIKVKIGADTEEAVCSTAEQATAAAEKYRGKHAADVEAGMASLDSGDGYYVAKGLMHVDSVADTDLPPFDTIFQDYGGDKATGEATSKGDEKRLQASLGQADFGGLWAVMAAAAAVLFPGRVFANLVLLWSLAGCKPQARHMDYCFGSRKAKAAARGMRAGGDMPVLMMVALQDGTTVRVWPGSWKTVHAAWARAGGGAAAPPLPVFNDGQMVVLTLNRGDVLFFRPDLVHAGDEFKAENLRLHAFLLSNKKALEYKADATHLLELKGHGLEEVAALLK